MESNGRRAGSESRLVALNFRVPIHLRRRLRIMAAEQGVTMTCLVLQLIEDAVRRNSTAGAEKSSLL